MHGRASLLEGFFIIVRGFALYFVLELHRFTSCCGCAALLHAVAALKAMR